MTLIFECKVGATDTEIAAGEYEVPATARANITRFYLGDGRNLTLYDTANPTSMTKVTNFNYHAVSPYRTIAINSTEV